MSPLPCHWATPQQIKHSAIGIRCDKPLGIPMLAIVFNLAMAFAIVIERDTLPKNSPAWIRTRDHPVNSRQRYHYATGNESNPYGRQGSNPRPLGGSQMRCHYATAANIARLRTTALPTGCSSAITKNQN